MTSEVINHLWQSTLFAGAAGLLAIAFRTNRAQVRYWLWFSASCKFLVPFVLLMSLGSRFERMPAAAATHLSTPAIARRIEQIAEPFQDALISVPSRQGSRGWTFMAILGVWACGFLLIALVRLRGCRRIHAAVRASTCANVPALVEVRFVGGLLEPGVVGWLRPILLLPVGITDRLTPPQLEAVLAHELCHVRRRDNLTSTIHMVVEAVFWFHPLVWWIGARLMEERERACDEEVLRLGSEPRVYAEGILNICKSYLESPLRCVSGVTGSDLKRRINVILAGPVAGELSLPRRIVLGVAGMAAFAVPFVAGVLNAPAMRGQTGEGLAFEVASVKRSAPVKPGQRVFFGPARGGPGTSDPGQITWTYVQMKGLMMTAYEVKGYQISGPSWFDTERYDVMVKVPAGATKEQVPAMWRNLLAERFGVKVRHESKELHVLEMVIARSGSKLKGSSDDPSATVPETGPKMENGQLASPGFVTRLEMTENGPRAHTTARHQALSQLTAMLTSQLETPVVDKTGLIGRYDFNLEFVPNVRKAEFPAGPSGGAGTSLPETDLATSLQQQLGLRLVASKALLDVVVVEKAEKIPTEN